MSRLLLRLLKGSFAVVLAGAAHADAVTSTEGRFSVEAPDAPAPSINYQWTNHAKGRSWVVSSGGPRPIDATNSSALERHYDFIARGLIDRPKTTLLQQGSIQRGDMKGRELIIQNNQGTIPVVIRQQMFVVQNRFYTIVYSGPLGTQMDSEVEAFLASFQAR